VEERHALHDLVLLLMVRAPRVKIAVIATASHRGEATRFEGDENDKADDAWATKNCSHSSPHVLVNTLCS